MCQYPASEAFFHDGMLPLSIPRDCPASLAFFQYGTAAGNESYFPTYTKPYCPTIGHRLLRTLLASTLPRKQVLN